MDEDDHAAAEPCSHGELAGQQQRHALLAVGSNQEEPPRRMDRGRRHLLRHGTAAAGYSLHTLCFDKPARRRIMHVALRRACNPPPAGHHHGCGCGEQAGPAWPQVGACGCMRACRSPPIRRHPWCQPRPRFARTTSQAAQLVACAVASAPASRYEFTRILAFTFAFGLDSALGFPFFYAVDRGHG